MRLLSIVQGQTTASRVLMAIGLLFAVNLLANQLLTAWRVDLTENRVFTLSRGTKNIVRSLDEPITLKFYFSNRLFSGIPQYQNYGVRVRDLLREYAAHANGKLQLSIIDPEPFSEAEDQAVGYGVQQLPIGDTGDMAYLGLAGTNSTDDEAVIPIFQPNKEESLEYDITKLIYNLAHPQKRVVGVMSTLPVFGSAVDGVVGRAAVAPWAIINSLREVFDVREVRADALSVDPEIDTLIVIHPKDINQLTQYALDQFVLKGGRALIMTDAFSEADSAMPNPETPGLMPRHDSALPELFKTWGVEMVKDKIAGDPVTAVRASIAGNRGPQEVDFLLWMGLTPAQMDANDFVTNQLRSINIASAGVLHPLAGASTAFTPLLFTSPQGGMMDADSIMFVSDPEAMLQNFSSDNKSMTLAARVRGPAKTAFPNGMPKNQDGSGGDDPSFVSAAKDGINIIVIGDSDLASDRFWVRSQNVMGVNVPAPIADNGSFIVNAVDNLGGNDDLISLRSRGKSTRTFTVVEQIQKEAEAQFRSKEQELQAKLDEAEKKLQALQQQKDEKSKAVLSAAQLKEIEKFKGVQVSTRKALRDVQLDLRRNIESLGTQLRLINIGLIPLLLAIFAMVTGITRAVRKPARNLV